jgi:hypothetical protein
MLLYDAENKGVRTMRAMNSFMGSLDIESIIRIGTRSSRAPTGVGSPDFIFDSSHICVFKDSTSDLQVRNPALTFFLKFLDITRSDHPSPFQSCYHHPATLVNEGFKYGRL